MSRAPYYLCSILSITALLAQTQPAIAGDFVVTLDAADGFVIENNTSAIERLRVDEATGNVSRNGALFVHTTGTDNVFLGEGAGNTSLTGFHSTAMGVNALGSNTSGYRLTAFGTEALRYNTTGSRNTALGDRALRANTTGYQNTAVGEGAMRLNSTGFFNTALGNLALSSNTTGFSNTGVGTGALVQNTTAGDNSAVGNFALTANTTGHQNSSLGSYSLNDNTTGSYNAAHGSFALSYNVAGSHNSAFGHNSLRYNTGSNNTGFGSRALYMNQTGAKNTALGGRALRSLNGGSRNVAVGYQAGSSQTTGSDNIYLDNAGTAGESGQIKIGKVGTHTQTTLAGVHNNTSSGGIAVLVNATGVLGTTTSSARFKQDIRDMDGASAVLSRLRPVVFRYRDETVSSDDADLEYGLIAEEVAEVAPELVARDAEGDPYSVRYHVLPAMLLNEMQKQQRVNTALRDRLGRLEQRLAAALPEVER